MKTAYELSCNEMKGEFEEIKGEMERTWNEQSNLHEVQLERMKKGYEKRIEFEVAKNADLVRENEHLRQKFSRIKDVFGDTASAEARNRQSREVVKTTAASGGMIQTQ